MKRILLAVSCLMISGTALGAGYGAAGCGLGSMVFEGNQQEWWQQTLAATTNGTGIQTFGITFGTSNCDANALVSSTERATRYIEANKNSVLNELSQGQGESVAVLANLLNCNQDAFSQVMKSNYSSLVDGNNADSAQLVERMSTLVSTEASCS